jgi:beta-lactam-binding protein with PASTA domain
MPNFVGLVRSEALAQAQKYHLVPAFEGATGDDAKVTDQSPTAGAPLSQADGRVRLQMKAQKASPWLSDILNHILNGAVMPDFVGRTRSEAIALAQEKSIKWTFYGATSEDAKVAGQDPRAGTPINAAAASVRLQMAAQAPPVPQVPDFVGRTRSEASALAPQYGLVPAFDGPPSDDAVVTSQSLAAGTPIFHVGTHVQLRIEAQEPPPGSAPTQQTTPGTGQQTTTASTQQTTPAQQTTERTTPASTQQTTPAAGQQTKTAPTQQTTKRTTPSCASRDLISWLTATPEQAGLPTCPASSTQNWLTLLAIIAALAGGTWAIFRRLWPPDPPEPIGPRFDGPPPITAQLVTQTISTGLAAMTASVHAADAPRFDIRYVMARDARPRPDAITITVDGGGDGA